MGLKRNIYACFVYYSPRNSSYNQNSDVEIIESISNDMSKYSLDGDVLLCGDFNARTGSGVADFINDDDDIHVPVADNYLQDKNIKYQLSQDPIVDTRGCTLIDLCIKSQLRILNGRFFGDYKACTRGYQKVRALMP